MTDTPDSLTVPIGAVQPSQLLINSEKLAAVVEWFDFDAPNYGALPARRIDGEWVLTDGHTRAFLSHLIQREMSLNVFAPVFFDEFSDLVPVSASNSERDRNCSGAR